MPLRALSRVICTLPLIMGCNFWSGLERSGSWTKRMVASACQVELFSPISTIVESKKYNHTFWLFTEGKLCPCMLAKR